MAELHLRDPYSNAQHFLGTVVLQANDVVHGSTPTKYVIDGQQRLTSRQRLLEQPFGLRVERQLLIDVAEQRLHLGPQQRLVGEFRIDPGRAAIHLGWKPWTTLDEGLALTIDWFRAPPEG